MIGNDNIVLDMIQRDLKMRGINRYYIKSEVAENPKKIKVKPNEMVYVFYLGSLQKDIWTNNQEFEIKFISEVDTIKYNQNNCRILSQDYQLDQAFFESSKISKHLSDLNIESSTEHPYHIHYLTIKLLADEKN